MQLLDKLVEVYREIGKPNLNQSSNFSVENVKLTTSLISKISSVWSDPNHEDVILEVVINHDRFDRLDQISDLSEYLDDCTIRINCSLPRQGDNQFYINTLDFIKRCGSLNYGLMPKGFYISDLDYSSNSLKGEEHPTEIQKVEHFCRLIKHLKKICHFVSHKDNADKAIFMVTDEESKESSPRSIELKFTPSLLELSFLNLSILEELVELSDTATHKFEKLSIFRISLWEILSHASSEDADIHFIGTYWEELLENYNKGYVLYIRGFSFTKFKNEIEEFQHNSIEKINDLLGNVVIKSLAVPSLFSVWLFILRSPKYDTIFSAGVCLALIFSATVIVFAIDNQQFLVEQVRKSIERSISNFLKKPSVKMQVNKKTSKELDDIIQTNNQKLQGRLKNISLKLLFLRLSIWVFIGLSASITFDESWNYKLPIEFIYLILFNIILFTLITQKIGWKLNFIKLREYSYLQYSK